MFWSRRRPSLSRRILGSLLLVGATVGLAVGAEALRRKLRVGTARVDVVRAGRRAGVRVSLRASRGGRRGSRSLSSSRS
jgi:hypothetical protein